MVNVRSITATLGMKGDGADKLAKFGLAIGGVKAALDIMVGAFELAKGVVFDFTAEMAASGDDIAKTANKIGETAEALQEISFAAQIAGADTKKITKAVQTMAKGLNDARNKGTGPFTDSINQLGIKVEEFDGLGPAEVFERFADEITKLKDPITQSAIAADVFGRSGKELIPFFKLGSKGIQELRERFRDLGGGFTNDGARAAEAFVDAQTELNVVVESFKILAAEELMPVLQLMIENITSWFGANKEIIRQRIQDFIAKMTAAFERLFPATGRTLDSMFKLVEVGADVILFLTELVESVGGLDKALLIAAGAFVGLKLASSAALGPVGLIAGAFIALLPLAISLGDKLGDVVFEMSELGKESAKLIKAAGGRTDIRGSKRSRFRTAKKGDPGSSFVKDDVAKLSDGDLKKELKDGRNSTFTRTAVATEIVSRGESKRAQFRLDERARVRGKRFKEQGENLIKKRRRKKRGGGKGKSKDRLDETLSDEELLQLIQKAGASGESLTGLIGDRKIPGGIPPVITITVNNFEQDIDVSVENNVTGVPGSSAEEVANLTTEASRDMLAEEFERIKDTLAPPTEI